MKKIDTSDNKVFNPTYNGGQQGYIFKTTFHQIDNTGGDIQVDKIIIFDGGDVYGYEIDNTNNI